MRLQAFTSNAPSTHSSMDYYGELLGGGGPSSSRGGVNGVGGGMGPFFGMANAGDFLML